MNSEYFLHLKGGTHVLYNLIGRYITSAMHVLDSSWVLPGAEGLYEVPVSCAFDHMCCSCALDWVTQEEKEEMRLCAGPRHCCFPSSFLPPFGAIFSLFGIGCGVARVGLHQLQLKRQKAKPTTGSSMLCPSTFYPEQTGRVATERRIT